MINKHFFNSVTSIVFIFGHLYNFSNKGYILFLTLFFILSYLINKNVIISLWHIFLTILPFQRGRYFLSFVVEKDFWGGSYPINIEYYFKFTDFIIVCLISLFIRLKVIDPQHKVFKIPTPKELLFLFLFLLSAGLATFNATHSWFAFYQYISFFIVISLAFVTAFIQKYKISKKLVINVFTLHTFIIVVLLCFQLRKGSQLGIELEQVTDRDPMGSFQFEAQNSYRPGGYFFDPNVASSWIIMTIPFLIYRIMLNEKKEVNNVISICLLFFFLAGLIITGSRFIWIVLLFLGVFYQRLSLYKDLFLQIVRKNKKLIISSLLVITLLSPILIFRISHFSHTFSEGGGIDYRVSHYLLALQYVMSNCGGIGLGMFKYEILGNFSPSAFAYDPTSPHNMLVEVAVGSGIFGLIFFCLFIYFNFKRQYLSWIHNRDHFFLAVFLSCVCYITIAQAYPYLLRSPIAEFFWIMIGFSLVNEKKEPDHV